MPTIDQSQVLSLDSVSRSRRAEDRQLLALAKLAHGLRDVLRFHDLIEKSSDILLEVFHQADRVAVAVQTGDQIEVRWWRERQVPNHDLRTNAESDQIAKSCEPFLVSRTLLAHVIDKCEAILTSDAQADFGDVPSIHALQLRSVLCAPFNKH